MIFLIDAQLPRRLAHLLQQYGHQVYHTLDLPQQNRTDDDEIMQFADTHDCIVTTKDSELRASAVASRSVAKRAP
jgi:predicted nuclease of predicted toxin-antitoxin system